MRSNDGILGFHYSQHLLRYIWRRETELTPVFRRAISSPDEKSSQTASYWVTVGNIIENLYCALTDIAAHGTTSARIGVVTALVDLAHHHDECRARCLEKLCDFLNDEDKKVLNAVNRIFYHEDILNTAGIHDFAFRFVNSSAFQRDPCQILGQLGVISHQVIQRAVRRGAAEG